MLPIPYTPPGAGRTGAVPSHSLGNVTTDNITQCQQVTSHRGQQLPPAPARGSRAGCVPSVPVAPADDRRLGHSMCACDHRTSHGCRTGRTCKGSAWALALPHIGYPIRCHMRALQGEWLQLTLAARSRHSAVTYAARPLPSALAGSRRLATVFSHCN
jgi:hypothetical protein